MRAPRRNPTLWLALISLAVALGLGSRRFGGSLPGFVASYSGDTLWALVAFLGLGLLLSRASTSAVTLMAISFSALIEISQLFKAPWLDSIRSTTPGGLILGFDFVWSDLVCYAVGVGLGIMIELAVQHRRYAPGS
jgi:hypothetical protein